MNKIITNTFLPISLSVVMLSLNTCSFKTKLWTSVYMIPMNYTGWVNIIYKENSATNNSLDFDNGHVYFITGNPSDFKINYNESLEKWYEKESYYYYSEKKIEKIPKNRVYAFGTLGDGRNDMNNNIIATTFYIIPLNKIEGFDPDNKPENPIYKKYPNFHNSKD